MLHHVNMSWMIETNQKLKYDIEKHNLDWIAGGPYYNTSTSEIFHGAVFENYIRIART